MRLIRLTCDQPTFKPVMFNHSGITLIVGDSSEDKQGSSNGVGKTLTLGLVHHCLGANANKKLAAAVPDWVFSLLISMDGKEYLISRTGDGKKITVNDNTLKLKELKALLNEKAGFNVDDNLSAIGFRSLFKRFARYEREDCINPIKTAKEQDYNANLITLYLLGLDYSLVVNKHVYKQQLDEIKTLTDGWKKDTILQNMFRAGTKPDIRAEFVDSEIKRLQEDLDTFQVADDYRDIELAANQLTSDIRGIEKEQLVISFQLENIAKSLETHPDITRQDLLDLYDGLQHIFNPDALAHFEAVESFHNSLAINRRTRLENDRLKLTNKHRELDVQRQTLVVERDKKLQYLHGKRALDEYAAIARQLAALEEEKVRLADFLNFSANLQEKAQKIREQKVKEDRLATEYVNTNPLATIDSEFRVLAQTLYPKTAAGISLEVNTGDNQIRYNIAVQIDGHDSDGINAARILCFDWTVFMHGANHSMDMLWHDNRLFADMDPLPRASWFNYVNEQLKRSGKQYIATINTENYDAMVQSLSPEVKQELDASVVLRLVGDTDANKLLGVSFG